MRIALGVHVSTFEVTASLVDTTLPELGPIATRTVSVAAAPGGIGGAVAAALGFMRVQAMQNDLIIAGGAVVCENALQREIVADALVEFSDPLPVTDIFDDRLSDAFSPDVSAALLEGQIEPALAPDPVRSERSRGVWPVAAVGACVLAALGGVTAWAMTSQAAPAGEASQMVYPTSGAAATSTTARTAPIAEAVSTIAATTSEAPGPEVVPADAYPDGYVDPGFDAAAPNPQVPAPASQPAAPVSGAGGSAPEGPYSPTRAVDPPAAGGGPTKTIAPTKSTAPESTTPESSTTTSTTTTTTTTDSTETAGSGENGAE